MDPAQLASEACNRFVAMTSATTTSVATATSVATTATAGQASPAGSEPLMDAFRHLCTLDAWAKVAMNRLAANPADSRARQDLNRSCEQAARLHPQFTRRLAEVLRAPVVRPSLTTGSIPVQVAGRAASEPRG